MSALPPPPAKQRLIQRLLSFPSSVHSLILLRSTYKNFPKSDTFPCISHSLAMFFTPRRRRRLRLLRCSFSREQQRVYCIIKFPSIQLIYVDANEAFNIFSASKLAPGKMFPSKRRADCNLGFSRGRLRCGVGWWCISGGCHSERHFVHK